MASAEKVYWDTCAWLGLVNGEEGRKGPLGNVYNQAKLGSIEIWSSVLSLVEANRLQSEIYLDKPIPADNLAALDDIFFQPFIKLVAVDIPISRDARRLIRETPKLSKKPDAIHLATALFWGVPVMHTYDGNDLLHLDGSMQCRDGSTLRICEPGEETDGGLFDRKNKKDSS